MNQWKDEYSNELYNQQYNQINKFFTQKQNTMRLSTTKHYNGYDAFLIVNWRNGNDYDIESVIIQSKNGIIDVTDMFTSDEIIEEIFGAIDWQMIYNQNHT
jgi:hypothetical protein